MIWEQLLTNLYNRLPGGWAMEFAKKWAFHFPTAFTLLRRVTHAFHRWILIYLSNQLRTPASRAMILLQAGSEFKHVVVSLQSYTTVDF